MPHASTLVRRQYSDLSEVSLTGSNFRDHDKANALTARASEHRRLSDERSTAALLLQIIQHTAATLHRTIEYVELHINGRLVRGLHDGRCFVDMPLLPRF